MTLRPYQNDLIDGANTAWQAGARRIAMVMATGGGKTVVFSHIARRAREQGRPTLVLAHRGELLDQAITNIERWDPTARVGRMQGPIKQWRADIVVGSVQTCSRPAALRLLTARRWGLIVVDETHHVAADTYQRVLRDLRAFDSDGPLTLGVTATLHRADGLSLGDTFEAIVEPQIGLLDLIRQGYLVRPRGIRVRIKDLDLDKVKMVAGELNAGQLGAAMHASMAPQRLVEAWEEHAKGRPTLAFMPTVAISQEVAAAFRAAGYRFEHLDDKTHPRERAAKLEMLRRGELDGLCNVGLFTEGTDLPMVSCVILKMTSSATLYTQMVGRGLRLHEESGKSDCIILDPAGVAKRHKLATMASLDGAPRPDDIPDDLLMYEDDAEEDAETEDDAEPAEAPEYEDGALDHELFDLFGESRTSWLRTPGGTWFVPVPNGGLLYLHHPHPSEWHVRWRWNGDDGAISETYANNIEGAMRMADTYIAQRPMWQAERDAPWREMRAWGSSRTKGEIADERDAQRAAQLLD